MDFFELGCEKKVDAEKIENGCSVVIFKGSDLEPETYERNCKLFLDIISDIPYPTHAFDKIENDEMYAYIRYDSEEELNDIVSVLKEESPFLDTDIRTGVISAQYIIYSAEAVETNRGITQGPNVPEEVLLFTEVKNEKEIFSSNNFSKAKCAYTNKIAEAMFKSPLSTYYLYKKLFVAEAKEANSDYSTPELIAETLLASYVNSITY